MNHIVDIIIPTYNNWDVLRPCLESILLHRTTPGLAHITIINNGHDKSIPESIRTDNPEITVIDAGKNIGWEGGLKLGLEKTQAPYVIFMNDDTYIPFSSAGWILQMLHRFADSQVAAVGPSSNCVMGVQNIFIPSVTDSVYEVNYLIGFCVMVNREYLNKVGGVDDSMPYHGDDLDLGIRFRLAGYKLLCDKNIFVYHHGFKTGQREFGSAWNSVEMSEKTNHHLIRKHGLKNFIKHIFNPIVKGRHTFSYPVDPEGDLVRQYSFGNVLELGCGSHKTVEGSIGIDIVPKGEHIPGLVKAISIADIVADVTDSLPVEDNQFDTIIARHLLEHVMNTRDVIKDWRRVLKMGGRLIIAVPDQSKRNSIPMNFQHVRAFTIPVLKCELESMGFKEVVSLDSKNNVSFVGVFEKVEDPVLDVAYFKNGKTHTVSGVNV